MTREREVDTSSEELLHKEVKQLRKDVKKYKDTLLAIKAKCEWLVDK